VRKFAYDHELERWTTIYDLFWPQSAEKTLAEIDALYEYKIHDPQTFINNVTPTTIPDASPATP